MHSVINCTLAFDQGRVLCRLPLAASTWHMPVQFRKATWTFEPCSMTVLTTILLNVESPDICYRVDDTHPDMLAQTFYFRPVTT